MTQDISAQDIALYEKVFQLLKAEWNPRGFDQNDERCVEYYMYAPHLVHLVKSGESISMISSSIRNTSEKAFGKKMEPEEIERISKLVQVAVIRSESDES